VIYEEDYIKFYQGEGKMTGSLLKTVLVAGLTAVLFLAGGSLSPLRASIAYESYSTGEAAFFAVDNFGTTGDGLVSLDLFTDMSGLQYRIGGGIWTDAGLMQINGIYFGTIDVSTGNDFKEIVYLRKSDGNSTAGIMFYAFDNPLWNGVALNFGINGSADFVYATPGSGDHVAPVPIPAALWMFGPALLGLAGIRKRITF
jgi:hypothetical protein